MSHVDRNDWVSVLRATVVGWASSFLLLIAGNFLALKSAHPDKLLALLAYIALTAGAIICGLAQREGYGSWKLPAVTGGVYALTLIVVSLIAGGAENLLMRVVVYLVEGAIVLLTSHFLPIGGSRRSGRGKKAAYRYLDRR